jgi:hypothetical protein
VRYCLAFVTLLAACGQPSNPGGATDGGSDELDAAIADADADTPEDAPVDVAPADAAIDAMPDAYIDMTAPSLVDISPGEGTAWLHAPIRFTFDEDLATVNATATATLAGQAVDANVTFEPPRTVVVTLETGAKGVGALDVHLSPQVADAAGNVNATPVDVQLQIPAWSSIEIDRGQAASAPSYVVTANGTVVAAWLIATQSGRRAVVAQLAGSIWTNLGDLLGATDVRSVSLALDEDGAPLVALVDVNAAHVSRWTGADWTELASPSSSCTQLALVTPANGHPILELASSTSVSLRVLADDAWQPLGSDIMLATPVAGDVALATPAAGKAVVGWVDTGAQLRVYRFDGSAWDALAPLSVSDGSRMSLAARGDAVAVAYDMWGGSWAVLAALATGGSTTFTQLGKPLDIAISGDARAPAIALDSGGTPLVAWTELVETAQRGGIGRWSGSAWTIVGGVTWLNSTTAIPLRGSRLVLGPGNAPVVATATGSQIVLARFNGPRTPSRGIAQRSSMAGCGLDPANPPANLSETGCFDLSTAKKPVAHPGLVPYDVVTPLWTDGAKKRRWIGLPDGESMSLGSNGSWTPPVGTIMVKEFALETTPGNPASRRPVETRFLVFTDAGLQGFTYRWNIAGTDATLQPDVAQNIGWQLDDGSTHIHVYPSRAQCRSCHYPAQGPLLGLRPEQLARWNDYGGTIADQMATLAALDVGPSSTPPAYTSPYDPSATWEKRMRGYMHANCSHCHNPQYVNIKDLRYATPLANTKLCDVIVPGSPADSVVYQKVTSRPGMPPFGTAAVDPLAEQLLGNWITGMTSCP